MLSSSTVAVIVVGVLLPILAVGGTAAAVIVVRHNRLASGESELGSPRPVGVNKTARVSKWLEEGVLSQTDSLEEKAESLRHWTGIKNSVTASPSSSTVASHRSPGPFSRALAGAGDELDPATRRLSSSHGQQPAYLDSPVRLNSYVPSLPSSPSPTTSLPSALPSPCVSSLASSSPPSPVTPSSLISPSTVYSSSPALSIGSLPMPPSQITVFNRPKPKRHRSSVRSGVLAQALPGSASLPSLSSSTSSSKSTTCATLSPSPTDGSSLSFIAALMSTAPSSPTSLVKPKAVRASTVSQRPPTARPDTAHDSCLPEEDRSLAIRAGWGRRRPGTAGSSSSKATTESKKEASPWGEVVGKEMKAGRGQALI